MSNRKKRNKWRFRCPEGHTAWAERENRYYCRRCDNNGDDPYFDYLEEAKADGFHY